MSRLNRGFSLIEMVVVVLMVGILAAMGFMHYSFIFEKPGLIAQNRPSGKSKLPGGNIF